ncbi:hypothetical protein PAI11_37570 [Patulibacter medicamentivorans]|uniref:Uncharacterized protein n=1 Tax=Patulibacter medicamentivorans TaxID=1097667 RepID=H0EA83_9ACTN|nr:hypothetical protein [Patulibacter medicamentivorans]EHN09423.1 hypothetical protein PAI11_37570 [Patulibacter medicamentivorans]
MANGNLSENNVAHELVVEGKSFGFFDCDELEWGVDASSVDDPEYGNVPTGGIPTGGDVEMNRPWFSARDTPAYHELVPQRGIAKVVINVHEVDGARQPVSSTPLDVLTGILGAVTKPAGGRGSSETARFKVGVQVAAR